MATCLFVPLCDSLESAEQEAYDNAVTALCSKLDPGSRAMGALHDPSLVFLSIGGLVILPVLSFLF